MTEKNIELLVRRYADEAQALDTAALDLLPGVAISTAVGVQLDGLGEIIGLERGNLTDDEYRSALLAQVKANLQSGTVEDIIAAILPAVGFTNTLFVTEYPPAAFEAELQSPIADSTGAVVAAALQRAKAAGVKAVLVWHPTAPVMAFDGEGGAVFDGGYFMATGSYNQSRTE